MSSTELAALTATIGEVTTAWKATDEVGADLGTEVQNAGDRLCQLLNELASTTVLPQDTRTALRDASHDVQSTVDHYAKLDEHDTDACLDIIARLPSALGLAQFAARQITAAETSTATVTDRKDEDT